MNISTEYSEDRNSIFVTVFQNRKPIVKVVTDKKSGITTTSVFKEGIKKPIEHYVFNKIL
jgi:hypothetical protein